MQQNLLFRHNDPETSRIAADGVESKLGQYQALFLERCQIWRSARGQWPTAQEVAGGNESIRKRANELVRAGVLVKADSRTCSVTGKLATTYRIKVGS